MFPMLIISFEEINNVTTINPAIAETIIFETISSATSFFSLTALMFEILTIAIGLQYTAKKVINIKAIYFMNFRDSDNSENNTQRMEMEKKELIHHFSMLMLSKFLIVLNF